MEMNILYQSDDNYVVGLGVSMTSLLINNKKAKEINIYIIDDGIQEDNKNKIIETVKNYKRSVTFIDSCELNCRFDEIGAPKYRGGYTTYYKVFAIDKIPASVDKLLYIDCDTIIYNIEDIFKINIADAPVAMAEDLFLYGYKKERGFGRLENMYSAGIILYNLESWRRNKCSDKVRGFLNSYDLQLLKKHDQDLLNIVFRNQIYKLSLQYNCVSLIKQFGAENLIKVYKNNLLNVEDIRYAEKNVRIEHFMQFCGKQPWHKGNINGCKQIYNKYKKKSLWHDCADMNKEESLFIKIEKILYRILPRALFLYLFRIAHDITKEI